MMKLQRAAAELRAARAELRAAQLSAINAERAVAELQTHVASTYRLQAGEAILHDGTIQAADNGQAGPAEPQEEQPEVNP